MMIPKVLLARLVSAAAAKEEKLKLSEVRRAGGARRSPAVLPSGRPPKVRG